ncbi:MAG: LPS assembly protein LptD, partial [Candidatus Aminicenantes bacterium]|nr:LPS assembly protein LptD [Candidatus Aminicenantes bacterium]
QTYRGGALVDFLDLDLDVDYFPNKHRDNAGKSFSDFRADLRMNPFQSVTFFFDARLDSEAGHFNVANVGASFDVSDRWTLFVGNRYDRHMQSVATVQADYLLTPKWTASILVEHDWMSGKFYDSAITLRRDMHEWIGEIRIERDQGERTSGILLNLYPKGTENPRRETRFVRSVIEANSVIERHE